jgi:hypothetical protein
MSWRRCFINTILLLSISVISLKASQLFVSTSGSDSNPGTFDQPYLTLAKALSVSGTIYKAGDTIYVRGGVYVTKTTINIAKYGTDSAYYHIFAYPGEHPVLDFSSMAYSSGNRGITLKGRYCHIRGFEVMGAGDNGMEVSGSFNIIENCSFHDNRDSGLQLDGGASNNSMINCDSYYNADPDNYGDADGFACKMDVGSGNYFYGCRSWMNVDDGWDGYLRGTDNVSTVLENCWTFKNGYLKNGADGGSNANGQGFKMGGSDTKLLKHDFKLTNCLSFMNKANGFDQNSNMGSMIIYNCTSFSNLGKNFYESKDVAADKIVVIKNCAELGNKITAIASVQQQTNSWMLNPVAGLADFISADTANFGGAAAARKDDGSLPDIKFMHLAEGSHLIDAGTDLGLPFKGKAPDLGCFETGNPDGVINYKFSPASSFELMNNYPNPFNPVTIIPFSLKNSGNITLKIYNALGAEVAVLADGYRTSGSHSIAWNASNMASGVYYCRLVSGNGLSVLKMILSK